MWHSSFSGASEAGGAGRLGKGGGRAGVSWHLLWADGQLGSLSAPREEKNLALGRQPLEMICGAFLREFTFPLTLRLIFFSFQTGVQLRGAWACKIPEAQKRVPWRLVLLWPPWKTLLISVCLFKAASPPALGRRGVNLLFFSLDPARWASSWENWPFPRRGPACLRSDLFKGQVRATWRFSRSRLA